VAYAPLEFTQSIILLRATIASFGSSIWTNRLIKGDITYTLTYIIFIPLFTYLYGWIVFNSKYILNLMDKYGYSLLNTHKSSQDYLNKNMAKALIITVLFLIGIAVIPDLAMLWLKIPYLMATLISGAGVITTVGVFSDIINQLVFYKNKKDSGIKDWVICYVAFDEIEAKIKSEFLKSKGIQALVEPLRFTWGMPIRTMVDQYRIYVPINKQEEARNFIK